MLIAELSGQGFLGFCAAVTNWPYTSYSQSSPPIRVGSSYDLPPSHKHWQLTSASSFCTAIVGTGKETQLAMWKSGLFFLLKYIIHSTFCWLNYSCPPYHQPSTERHHSACVLLSRLGQNYETVIVGHELTPGWAQDRGGIQNTVSSMGQYYYKRFQFLLIISI